MRNGQHQHQNKRMRGRNRKSQNPLTRVYESNGPDVKVRGTASHIADKYMQLARDAQSSGDPVGAENYYQHAEHYLRIIAAVQEQFRQSQPFYRDNEAREGGYDEGEDDGMEPGGMGGEPYAAREPREQGQPYPPRESQSYGQREHREGREHRGGEGRELRDREQRDREPREQRFQQRDREQPYPRQQQQPAPQPVADESDIDRLPAFVTGGQSAAPASGGHPQNGFEGAPDRFPLHRRRRRRHGGPREGASGGEAGDAPRE